MPLVLHPDVVLAWFLPMEDGGSRYADRVLDALAIDWAVVPGSWAGSLANALYGLQARGTCRPAYLRQALALLAQLNVVGDALPPALALADDLTLSQAHSVPAGEAAYLALSMRTGIPLAACSPKLRQQAHRLDVRLYEPDHLEGEVDSAAAPLVPTRHRHVTSGRKNHAVK